MNKIPTYNEIVDALANIELANVDIFRMGLKSQDDHVRWHAIKGCGLKRDTESIFYIYEILAEPLSDPAVNIRSISAWALSKFDFETIYNLFVNTPEFKTNELVRQGAADVFGLLVDHRALPLLDILLSDSSDYVILWAALSISKYGPVAIPYLSKHLFEDSLSKAATAYLIDALHRIKSADANNIIEHFKNKNNNKDIDNIIEMVRNRK